MNFNPRPPRGERLLPAGCRDTGCQFQSTPSARRATQTHGVLRPLPFVDFNPRPPRGERRKGRVPGISGNVISIHALREESDWAIPTAKLTPVVFQSTPSARRATCNSGLLHFRQKFQSTPSARRATPGRAYFIPAERISIHALREESDMGQMCRSSRSLQFQSTPSARRATDVVELVQKHEGISIHALREESDVS